jgi:hypothetical protein
MQKDALRQLLAQIEEHSRQKGIEPFYGEVEEGEGPKIRWTRQEEGDWEQFLKALARTDGTVLIVSTDENDLDYEEEYTVEHLEHLPQDVKEEYRDALNVLKKTKGQLAYFTLTFFQGLLCFQYTKYAPWYEAYALVLDGYDSEEDDTPIHSEGMNPEQIEECARKFIHDPKYQSAKDRMERSRIASAHFEKAGIVDHSDSFKILRKAELLFVEEIQPILEQELGKKVKELKDKGHKKVEVRAKLGISQSTLNRHWY